MYEFGKGSPVRHKVFVLDAKNGADARRPVDLVGRLVDVKISGLRNLNGKLKGLPAS
jgi:hypothetical protein